ncbi:G protein-regulated inducer of neurite outgrowth 1 [Anabas testudineus]|uniref:G protein-regulated inducer of neurite outgrowth C-terminal domain-containing protein n=1 Tax=Anabas testudineus TaxID=64144 RepID=A0A3Q1HDG5_ANATE|nr:G protein-regulated inducer of neurite outgrowth 1 [Anabas testudineus]
MGSLKDEMKGLKENHQPCGKPDDGECPGGSDGSSVPERPAINTSQESVTEEGCQPKLQMNASFIEDGEKNPKSKDQELSGGDCGTDFIQVKDCIHVDAIALTQQAGAEEITIALHNDVTISDSNKFLSDGDGDTEIQKEKSDNKSLGQDREKEAESIVVPVPSAPDPFDPRSPDPRSPAPFGQHHVRTQVSLEVVQSHSAATSPMTPPEGGNSFFFPNSFGRSAGVGTDSQDAELQVGKQVEFCSVATSPMTPKTPWSTAFPELTGREMVQKEGKVKKSEEQKESGEKESLNKTESEKSGSASCPDAGLMDTRVTVEDSNQQCKQQRMGSMDQDITILVTHYSNNEEGGEEKAESSFYSIEPEMVKIDEYEELIENKSDVKRGDGKEDISAETAHPEQVQNNTKPPQIKTEETSIPASGRSMTSVKSANSEVKENTKACEELTDVTKPPVPESPAPFGCHNIRTQVSLEVVQCQSVATSPMTPPEGEQAFYFPSSFGKCATVSAETKDAEMQVGQQVEFRSVATAPMTPRTPTATTFPDIRKEVSIEEKIMEEEEDRKEQAEQDKGEEPREEEQLTEEKKEEAAEKEEMETSKEKAEDKCEEPVQEVSWDEKGMTWEVYGAVVEVSVLGSAIQKHLEKQVKKQKRQPSMPPPPPLTPSATPLTSEPTQGGSGSGKGQAGKRGERDGKARRRRRNPFRLLMENMQQPHCCSRAHTAE